MFTPVLPLTVLLALWTPSATMAVKAPGCSPTAPGNCPNVNWIAGSPTFQRRIKSFLGNSSKRYFGYTGAGSLASQALLGLGGPPSPVVNLSGQRYLFAACPPHDCAGNAVAVILNKGGHVLAVGFSSFHCGKRCDINHRYVDIYVRVGPLENKMVRALNAWASSPSVRDLLNRPGVDRGLHRRTAVHVLPSKPVNRDPS